MSESILRLKQVCLRVGYSRTGLYELLRAGKFCRPRSLGPRAIGFLESEVDEWIRSRPLADPKSPHIAHVSKRRKAQRDASCTARTA